MITSFFYGLILEARADIQKCFRSFFGSNENFRVCFQYLLTFSKKSGNEISYFFYHKTNVCTYSSSEFDENKI